MSQPAIRQDIIIQQTYSGTYCVRCNTRLADGLTVEGLLEELKSVFEDATFVKNGDEIAKLEEEIDALGDQIADLKGERDSLEDKITDREIAYDRLKEDFDQLYSDYGELRALQQSR